MHIALIILSSLGLIIIFWGVYKRVKRAERVKVKPSQPQQQAEGDEPTSSNFREAMSWKRKSIDYKALNDAYNQADLYYSKGNFVEAEQGFIRVISMQPDHPEANNKLGIIYIKQNQLRKAEAVFRMLTESYPNKPTYFSNLGRVLYNQKRLEQAAWAYQQAINLDPRRIQRHLSLGQVYRELDKPKSAISSFSKALELNPRNKELYFIIVELLDQLHAYEEAVAYLKGMLEIFPYNDKAKQLVLDFRRKMELSPLSTEQKAQLRRARQARTNQNSLFKNIPAGETVPQSDSTTSRSEAKEAKPIPPAPNQVSLDDIAKN